MRLISCSMTEGQVRARKKDVTRRLGWLTVEPGEHLMFCRKVMGRKPGEPLVKIVEIEVVSKRRELLRRMIKEHTYGVDECRREGFPTMTPRQFVNFFCKSHPGCVIDEFGNTETMVTRIEFKYIGETFPAPEERS